jgi:hypothetical protein
VAGLRHDQAFGGRDQDWTSALASTKRRALRAPKTLRTGWVTRPASLGPKLHCCTAGIARDAALSREDLLAAFMSLVVPSADTTTVKQ